MTLDELVRKDLGIEKPAGCLVGAGFRFRHDNDEMIGTITGVRSASLDRLFLEVSNREFGWSDVINLTPSGNGRAYLVMTGPGPGSPAGCDGELEIFLR